MRSRLSDLRTLPSSSVLTLSRRPISRGSVAARNWKAAVRDATRRRFTRARALMISSAMPSQKYS